LVGQLIDKYRVVGVVGRGGMGCVYEAVNTSIQKRVAMKCIDQQLARNPEANARFQREALAASAVESPYIVQIFDAGETDEGMPFIVMELLRGQDLGGYITELGKLDVAEAMLITSQVLKGLHHAHAAGIVHRDLKPDNVFLVEREDEPLCVKLLDFGVSKIARSEEVPLKTLTRQGTVVGTPFYMSPEQAQAFPDVDGRTDIYSVGAILYECLTGKPPHCGKSYEQVIVNICMKDPEDVRIHNPAVPDDLAKIISKALAREREDRYPDARALLNALIDAAPEQLKQLTPSSQLRRISARPGASSDSGAGVLDSGARVTPRIISGEHASGLADTVSAESGSSSFDDSKAGDSGVSTVAASTIRSPSLKPENRPRWLMPIVALGLVVTGGVIYLSLDGSSGQGTANLPSAEQAQSATASSPSPRAVATPSLAPSAPSSKSASASQDATTSSSLPAKVAQPRNIGAGAQKAPPASSPSVTAATTKTATPAAPSTKSKGGLEILTR